MMNQLVTKLNSTDVPFVRDAWVEAPQSDYGVCEMVGEPQALWGDDAMIAQRMTVNVYLYNRDGTDTNAVKVNKALNEADVMFTLTGRDYLPELNMIRWSWRVMMEKWY